MQLDQSSGEAMIKEVIGPHCWPDLRSNQVGLVMGGVKMKQLMESVVTGEPSGGRLEMDSDLAFPHIKGNGEGASSSKQH
jgi:hypothetical protein